MVTFSGLYYILEILYISGAGIMIKNIALNSLIKFNPLTVQISHSNNFLLLRRNKIWCQLHSEGKGLCHIFEIDKNAIICPFKVVIPMMYASDFGNRENSIKVKNRIMNPAWVVIILFK